MLLTVSQPGTSQTSGRQNGVRSLTVEEGILASYNKAQSLPGLVDWISPLMLPGDDRFVFAKFSEVPELLKMKKIPVLTWDQAYFKVSIGKIEVTLRMSEQSNFEFELNHQKFNFFPGSLPQDRWDRIADFLGRTVPLENDTGTLMRGIVFLLSSAISHGHANSLALKIGVGDILFPFTDLWKATTENADEKSECSSNFLLEISKAVSDIQALVVRCDKNEEVRKNYGLSPMVTQFQIPIWDGGTRYLYIDSMKSKAIESASVAGGKDIIYNRSHEFDVLPWENLVPKKETGRVRRKLGFNWVASPADKSQSNSMGTENTLNLRAQQLREIFETAYVINFCHRCASMINVASQTAITTQKYTVVSTPVAKPEAKPSADSSKINPNPETPVNPFQTQALPGTVTKSAEPAAVAPVDAAPEINKFLKENENKPLQPQAQPLNPPPQGAVPGH